MSKDRANEWLKENDAEYSKRDNLEYPYLSGRQFGKRCDREIPVSCLDTYLARVRTGMCEDELLIIKEKLS